MRFDGAIVAIVTPFRDGRVDKDGFLNLIESLIQEGIEGIVPCGTTGESATLSHAEHEQVIDLAVEAARKRVPVIAGTGSNSTAEALKLTQHARAAGADAALLVAPYYNRPTQEGLYQHYRRIAEEVDLPLIPYNIPGRTGVNILPSTVARLAQIPNIVGIKEASGSLGQISEVIALCGEDFVVLSGDDALTLPILAVGGQGVISVVANVLPRDTTHLVKAFRTGHIDEARRLHHRLLPLVDALFWETNPIPVKAALALMGKISPELRLPLTPLSEPNLDRMRRVLVEYGLI